MEKLQVNQTEELISGKYWSLSSENYEIVGTIKYKKI